MSKFETGDRVRIKKGSGWDDLEGLTGILTLSDNGIYLHMVLDNPPDDTLRPYFPVVPGEIELVDD